MKRKVKIFSGSDTDNGLDERINDWIEDNGAELLDVRVTFDQNKVYGFMQATATVIYTDKSEGRHEIQSYRVLRKYGRQ